MLLEFLVLLKTFFERFSNGSMRPLDGLYKTFINVLLFFRTKFQWRVIQYHSY